MRPEIGVVMATRGRPELLRRCLEALLRQQLPPECFEVLVVDDGPHEATRQVVLEMAALAGGAPAVRYLQNHRGPGPAGARNCGWLASAAPLIAFTDDDTVPDPGWLLEGQRAMQDGLVAVRGRVQVPLDGPCTDHALNTLGLEHAEFVTANCFVRRDALREVGGFDERFRRAWREDSDLHFSLLEAGGKIGFAGNALVLHPVRPAPWGISLSQQRNVTFDALLYKKHRNLYLCKVRSQPPWLYLGIFCLSVAALVSLASGAVGAALGCVLGVALCMAVFTLRRLQHTSRRPSHVAEMIVTSMAIPYLALWWRLVGALRFRVLYP